MPEGASAFLSEAWSLASAILDDALRIGRQAPEIDPVRARDRLDAARARA
ncbi:hypothetical protein AEGHOMDF_0055 [Methylobacterium soli]|nr:hypothetical protein AEGHOMDF_0055 [Methylobacterium soli]